MKSNRVFHNTVDHQKWYVEVLQDQDTAYAGTLYVYEGPDKSVGTLVHSETVPISYGAPFGPDTQDVAEWHDKTIDVIDHPEKRKVVTS